VGASCNAIRRENGLELAAIAGLVFDHGFALGLGFKCRPYLSGARQRPADVSVFCTDIERDQSIAVLAVRLKSVTKLLRALSKYLRAFRAFDLYFFVDHETSQVECRDCVYPRFKGVFKRSLKIDENHAGKDRVELSNVGRRDR